MFFKSYDFFVNKFDNNYSNKNDFSNNDDEENEEIK